MVTLLVIVLALLLIAALASGSSAPMGQSFTITVGPGMGAQTGGADVLGFLLLGGLLFVLFIVLTG